jgi:hypothetical protein
MLAAGCQLRPNPSYIPSWPDMAPVAVTAPDSQALPPPGDQALPPPADLGASPVDLMSPCIRVSESFASDPAAHWTLMGDTSIDPPEGGLLLTSLGFNVAGSAFYDVALPASSFDARFTFRIGDGSGADGLAFVVAEASSVDALSPYGNGVLNAGYGLGYLGMAGFAIELDTFMNIGNGDPDGNHVSLVRTSDGAHLLSGTPVKSLRSSTSRRAHIRLAGSHLTVEIDGDKTIDDDLPSGFAVPSGARYFGFTAASSVLDDHHSVSDLTLIVGPGCF